MFAERAQRGGRRSGSALLKIEEITASLDGGDRNSTITSSTPPRWTTADQRTDVLGVASRRTRRGLDSPSTLVLVCLVLSRSRDTTLPLDAAPPEETRFRRGRGRGSTRNRRSPPSAKAVASRVGRAIPRSAARRDCTYRENAKGTRRSCVARARARKRRVCSLDLGRHAPPEASSDGRKTYTGARRNATSKLREDACQLDDELRVLRRPL